ncbi:MAG: DUF2339 domain-containing protein [Chloracidobacterium sp.]|nr:DUF2339 domain-containing protein [Chloracidobacterium sp.]
MPEERSRIDELEARLERLVRTQIDFQAEVFRIRDEIAAIRSARQPSEAAPPKDTAGPGEQSTPTSPQPEPPRPKPPPRESPNIPPPTFGYSPGQSARESAPGSVSAFERYVKDYVDNAKGDLEKFVGENLIAKIGVVVLIIGVGIGVKYSIDNNLISPIARVILGYAFGFGLTGLAIKLKPKYHNFSAALVSGGMAIMYFVTYFAYSAYALLPQSAAFALMALFTLFTVTAALVYRRQVIAHIGLVGAYAVPFLLSDDSGNYLFLFSYMSILNAGILVISIKRYWTAIFYTASAFTWAIFGGWLSTRYTADVHFELALSFLSIFFVVFYASKLAQAKLHAEHDKRENLISTIATVCVFYIFALAVEGIPVAEAFRYWAFFTVLAGVSAGVLITSFWFHGRFVIYAVMPFVWLIFGDWYIERYDGSEHFWLAAIFSAVFFAMFYSTVLAQRLASDQFSIVEKTGLFLTNSFLFYGFGYSMIDGQDDLRDYLGLFTAAHAGLHFLVAQGISRSRPGAVDVVQILTILVLTFASIAIPVQFNGNAVTMIWAAEGALLFWFGRTHLVRLFEFFSYPVMLLAAASMLIDWFFVYADRTGLPSESNRVPLANGDLVTALVVAAAFAFVFVTYRNTRDDGPIPARFGPYFGGLVAAIAAAVLYNAFRIEISNYHHIQSVQLRAVSVGHFPQGLVDLVRLNFVWQLNYTMAFAAGMTAANVKYFRSKALAAINAPISLFLLLLFTTAGMFAFNELRESYISSGGGPINIWIRYVSYTAAGVLLYSLYRYSREAFVAEYVPSEVLRLGFEGVLTLTILIAVSGELINLMGQFGVPDATKLGLSILWGAYALVLVVIGIAWNKKELRIGAFGLLGVTLAKLFLYDIADLDTIPKTILFVTLGIILLVVSFLYNKYKTAIFGIGTERLGE